MAKTATKATATKKATRRVDASVAGKIISPQSIIYYSYICRYVPEKCMDYTPGDVVDWPFPSGYTPPPYLVLSDGSDCDGAYFAKLD